MVRRIPIQLDMTIEQQARKLVAAALEGTTETCWQAAIEVDGKNVLLNFACVATFPEKFEGLLPSTGGPGQPRTQDAERDMRPPFDTSKQCDLNRLHPGDTVPTMCERCHNPHHACDRGEAGQPQGATHG